ncbi:hypothetical protein L210DRAFT_3639314 [Boletus edulis BED1]|uniref:Uncharacterized protein n=1 Tax=Boletus edulis BED1 TaxID=1328754 RepID=A0AAD4GMM7_BOLED|nr:hypothetical protein L210DRAFT_3639314 [Boletus edulis BED1]
MSGLETGKYLIQLAAGSQPSIGVDAASGSPDKPVVTDGSAKIWFVKRLESGLYHLTIEDRGMLLFIQNEGRKLVGNEMPPPSVWSILPQDDGSYTIQVPNRVLPPTYWTVDRPYEMKYPVTLNILDFPFPQQNQKWYFRRLY